MFGLDTWVATVPQSKVYPSGAALAARVVPGIEAAPPSFSMMKGCPSSFSAAGSTMRATPSAADPAGRRDDHADGTGRIIGLRGRGGRQGNGEANREAGQPDGHFTPSNFSVYRKYFRIS